MLHWVLKGIRERLHSQTKKVISLEFQEPVWSLIQAGGKLDYLHQFLQFSLDIIQSTNVLPADVGHFHNSLAQSRWVALAQGPLKSNTKYLI